MSFLLRIEEKKSKFMKLLQLKRNKTKQNWIWSIQYRTKETKKKHLVKQVISREFLNLETDLF